VVEEYLARIGPADEMAMRAATQRQLALTKPAGSLGVLEELSIRVAGMTGSCPPAVPAPAVVTVFAADHGVHAQGVSPWPQEVTAAMLANFAAGGAAVNAFATNNQVDVRVVDVGVAADVSGLDIVHAKVRPGTRDLSREEALTPAEVLTAIRTGFDLADELVRDGYRCLLTGDMGIANTTASAALIATFTGTTADDVTGRGTGIDDQTLAHKTEVVREALMLHDVPGSDPVGVLGAYGGLEHAALAGYILGGAANKVPVILDGVIAGAAALVAQAFHPAAIDYCVAGHRSAEAGHAVALKALGLQPLVDLDLRLGEGTGAVLAYPIVSCAVRALAEMATFESAGIDEGAGA
jgi:nicotinate-nucleotide--dimethylbenzimidazole phosphoribosyltransferase